MTQTAIAEITPQAAAQEILCRRHARRNLIPFAEYLMPTYEAAWFHRELAAKLELVEQGVIKRLMVSMPPRHGKSRLCTIFFPLWCLGRHPDWYITTAGYNDDIAMKHSRTARDFYMTLAYNQIFPPKTKASLRFKSPDRPYAYAPKHSGHEWEVSSDGGYYAVGVEGGLTGRGFQIGIIDDPHKNREEAESETKRMKIDDWWRSTFYTRMTPDAAIVYVANRWHPHDQAGLLLEAAKNGGDKWETISYPATCDKYDALWAERYDAETLARIKLAIGDREWGSLYQQEPTVRGGNVFKVDYVQYHDDLSEFPAGPYVRFWDLASTVKERAKADPDFSVGPLISVTYRDGLPHLWVRDVVFGQWEAPERDRKILETEGRDNPGWRYGIEAVAGYKDTAINFQRLLAGRRIVEVVPVSKDKVVRASPLEPIFDAGHVHVLKAPWNDLFYSQFAGFPKGAKHDDIVDGVSGAYAMLVDRAMPEGMVERFDGIAVFGGIIRDLDGGL